MDGSRRPRHSVQAFLQLYRRVLAPLASGSHTSQPRRLPSSSPACNVAPRASGSSTRPRQFFFGRFSPRRRSARRASRVLTGYTEPFLQGSRTLRRLPDPITTPAGSVNPRRDPRGAVALLHAWAQTDKGVEPYATRAHIEPARSMVKPLSSCTLVPPVEVFFMHIQARAA